MNAKCPTYGLGLAFDVNEGDCMDCRPAYRGDDGLFYPTREAARAAKKGRTDKGDTNVIS